MKKFKPTEFLKNNRDFFKNCKFKFEGLKPKTKSGFIRAIEDLGGQIAEDATITFVDDEYFMKNPNRTDLYKLNFLVDSIEGGKILNINSYRYNITDEETKLSSTNITVNEQTSNNALVINLNKNENSAHLNKDLESEKFQNSIVKKENYTSLQKESKTFSESSSEDENSANLNDDLESNKFQNSTVEKENYTSLRKQSKIFSESSEDENTHENTAKSSRRFTKIKQEVHARSPFRLSIASTSGESKKSITSISDDSDDSELHISDVEDPLSIPEVNNSKAWWSKQNIPDRLCTIQSCSFSPKDHGRHSTANRNISLTEKRIALAYLIQTNNISIAKGLKVWKDMISEGYLKHRTVESLRNCFRRVILPNINTFGLPRQIRKQFQALIYHD